MGNCCASTAVKGPPHSRSAPNSKQRITAPPPLTHPLLEEETVKEVLSETPTLPKPTPPVIVVDNEPRKHPSLSLVQHRNDGDLKKPTAVMDFNNPEELSEDFSASEICSTLSESVPATTPTATDKIDHEDGVSYVVKPQRSPARARNRAFPGEVRREKSVGSSPSRRFEPSSLGRVRSGTARDPGRRSPANGPRKENYENTGRRSISPATRTQNGGSRTSLVRSPSVRKTGKSPGRVRSDMGDKNRKLEESCSKQNWETTNSNELLENPLVSLECFIFL